MKAIAKKTIDLDGVDDLPLADHDFVRFPHGKWQRIDIRETEDGLIVNTDLGAPVTIEMASSNQFVIKWPQK